MPISRFERKEKLGHGGVSEIARRTGLGVSTVSMVLNGHIRNRKIEVAIARKLRVKVTDAFPEHYAAPPVSGAP